MKFRFKLTKTIKGHNRKSNKVFKALMETFSSKVWHVSVARVHWAFAGPLVPKKVLHCYETLLDTVKITYIGWKFYDAVTTDEIVACILAQECPVPLFREDIVCTAMDKWDDLVDLHLMDLSSVDSGCYVYGKKDGCSVTLLSLGDGKAYKYI